MNCSDMFRLCYDRYTRWNPKKPLQMGVVSVPVVCMHSWRNALGRKELIKPDMHGASVPEEAAEAFARFSDYIYGYTSGRITRFPQASRLLRLPQHKLAQALGQPLRLLQRQTMPALLKDVVHLHLLGDLEDVLLDRRAEELGRADGHDGQRQFAARLEQVVVDVAVLQAGAVRFEDAAQAAGLLDAFDPVVQCDGLDGGGVVAFGFDEHFLSRPSVSGWRKNADRKMGD